MMEQANSSSPRGFNLTQLTLELQDVSDIARAANSSLASLVDCLVNVPAGQSEAARVALEKALGGATKAPPLTLIETGGEFPFFQSSISCVAVVPGGSLGTSSPLLPLPRQGRSWRASSHKDNVSTRVASHGHGQFWLTAEGDVLASWSRFWERVTSAVREGGGRSTGDLVDCTAFLPANTTESMAEQVRDSIMNATGIAAAGAAGAAAAATVVPAALTMVKVGDRGIKLRCSGLIGGAQKKKETKNEASVAAAAGGGGGGGGDDESSAGVTRVVVAGGFAYTDGIGAAKANATAAFSDLARALESAGTRMDLVANCLFFMADPSDVMPLFGGFYQAFNQNAPPPPSRTEFVGRSPAFQCSSAPCPVLAKCVAVMPSEVNV
eukprot:g1082.t1